MGLAPAARSANASLYLRAVDGLFFMEGQSPTVALNYYSSSGKTAKAVAVFGITIDGEVKGGPPDGTAIKGFQSQAVLKGCGG